MREKCKKPENADFSSDWGEGDLGSGGLGASSPPNRKNPSPNRSIASPFFPAFAEVLPSPSASSALSFTLSLRACAHLLTDLLLSTTLTMTTTMLTVLLALLLMNDDLVHDDDDDGTTTSLRI